MMKMALDAYLDSNYHLTEATSAGFLQSSSSDGSFEEHGQYQAGVASPSNASSGNLPSTSSRIGNPDVGIVPLDFNPITVSNSRASSLVPGSNYAFPEGPNMHRNITANMGSDYNLHSAPALLTSHDLRVSSSSIENGAFTAQQVSHLAPKKPQVSKKKQQQKALTPTSRQGSQKLQNSPLCMVKPETVNLTQRQKKPRLYLGEEAIPEQFISQQPQQNPDSVQVQRHNTPQIPALIQHHMHQNSNQQNVSYAAPQLNGVFIQPQQQQLRNQVQQQVVHRVSNDHQVDEGACTRRVMQYIRNLRQRPLDNNLAYWRRFVAEYFAPDAKKRWCVSLYGTVGTGTIGVAPRAAEGAWKCDMCGCRSGKGFEAVFEILPRLNKLKFENGVTDELLFLDFPREYRFTSGLTVLKYGKAVQENIYEKFRVVFEGQLCVVFTCDLKILTWEFCANSHEVFVPRSLVSFQMVHAAQKYQSRALHGALLQGSQTNSNQIQDAGFWFADALDIQMLDDWGFSKRYTRCLQMAQIVQSMKDLMRLSLANRRGPIETLKIHRQEIATAKFQRGELERKPLEYRDLPTENLMSAFPVVSTNVNDGSNMARGCFGTVSEQESALPGYDHRLGPKTSSSTTTNNFAANGLSSSSRSDQISEVHRILQELMSSRAAKEVEGQVANLSYISKETTAASENSFGRTVYLPASYDMDLSKSAASDLSSRVDQI